MLKGITIKLLQGKCLTQKNILIYRQPLYVQKYSEIDIKFFKKLKTEDIELFFFVIGEIGQHVVYSYASKIQKNRVDKSIIVFDLKGVNVLSMFVKLKHILKASQKVLDRFYPETMEKLYIVNSGIYLIFLWI